MNSWENGLEIYKVYKKHTNPVKNIDPRKGKI
jgi:hypothetical protein